MIQLEREGVSHAAAEKYTSKGGSNKIPSNFLFVVMIHKNRKAWFNFHFKVRTPFSLLVGSHKYFVNIGHMNNL